MRIAFYRVLVLIGLIGLWWYASTIVERNLVPSPWAALQAAQRLIAEGRLGTALADSLAVYLGGYAFAVLVGVPLGLFMGMVRPLGKTLEVYVYALSATPRVAFIPLIIVLLGLGVEAKIVIVFLGAVMPVLINSYAGGLHSDQDLIEMARSVGAPRRRIFTQILLPGAVPFILTGLRIGATIGLVNTVVAELYTAVKGLGGLLATYGNTFRMAEYFVVVITLAVVGMLVTEILRFLENRLGRWRAA